MTTAATWQPGFGPILRRRNLTSTRRRKMKIKSATIKHNAESKPETAKSQPELLRFAKKIADLMHESEPGEDGKPFDQTSEDAIAMLNQLILEARQLLGTAEMCGECGETVAYVIGCPDGAEICQGCFDLGQH